mgnify:CR=1 FL=1
MRILVTGGAGFIGSHLCEALIEKGNTVTALDDLSTGRIENLSNSFKSSEFNFVEGSILDTGLLNSLIDGSDYIFHLAAAVGVFNSVNNPLKSLLTNIQGTENILQLAEKSMKPIPVEGYKLHQHKHY